MCCVGRFYSLIAESAACECVRLEIIYDIENGVQIPRIADSLSTIYTDVGPILVFSVSKNE